MNYSQHNRHLYRKKSNRDDSHSLSNLTDKHKPTEIKEKKANKNKADKTVKNLLVGKDNEKSSKSDDPFNSTLMKDPFAKTMKDPFATTMKDPFASKNMKDPFATTSMKDPFASTNMKDPFASAPMKDPFATAPMKDPFATTNTKDPFSTANTKDPLNSMKDPFSSEGQKDPFSSESQKNPFEVVKEEKEDMPFKESGLSLGLKTLNSKPQPLPFGMNPFKNGAPSPSGALFFLTGQDGNNTGKGGNPYRGSFYPMMSP